MLAEDLKRIAALVHFLRHPRSSAQKRCASANRCAQLCSHVEVLKLCVTIVLHKPSSTKQPVLSRWPWSPWPKQLPHSTFARVSTWLGKAYDIILYHRILE